VNLLSLIRQHKRDSERALPSTSGLHMPLVADPDRFAKIAAGLQSLVIAGAFVVGGIWTLYSFNSQLQVENARGQLQKVQRELAQEPKVELSATITQVKVLGAKRLHLIGQITVQNVGNAITALNLEDRPIKIYRVSIDDSGEARWTLVHQLNSLVDTDTSLGSLISQAGSKNLINFATSVDKPGLYVLKFQAERGKEEQERARQTGAFEKWGNTSASWSCEHYFVVQ
jgi:hypothetical protein